MLSPKQIGTICFAIFSILISAPLFATGVSSGATSADCDNATLDTYTGTSNLQADWQPNTIALHWYNGDTEITSGVQTSCVYDGALTPPTTIPTKTGYTFKGWRVRQTPCSFANQVCGLTGSTLDSLPSAGYGYTRLNGNVGERENTYGLTTGSGEWAASFTDGGVVKGIASCNNNKPDSYDTVMADIMNGTISIEQAATLLYGCSSDTLKPADAFSSSSTGQQCWCKMTSYTSSGGQCSMQPSFSWVYTNERSSASDCATYCAQDCGVSFSQNIANFRRIVFGVER